MSTVGIITLSSTRSTRKAWINRASTSATSVRANWAPMQTRGPTPGGSRRSGRVGRRRAERERRRIEGVGLTPQPAVAVEYPRRDYHHRARRRCNSPRIVGGARLAHDDMRWRVEAQCLLHDRAGIDKLRQRRRCALRAEVECRRLGRDPLLRVASRGRAHSMTRIAPTIGSSAGDIHAIKLWFDRQRHTAWVYPDTGGTDRQRPTGAQRGLRGGR